MGSQWGLSIAPQIRMVLKSLQEGPGWSPICVSALGPQPDHDLQGWLTAL